jgi:periplasmic protein TonB
MIRKVEAQTIRYIRNSNWLFRGLVLLSIVVHALALGHIEGLYKREPISYIELEIRASEKPSGRSIPVPPKREKTKPQLTAQGHKLQNFTHIVKPPTTPPAPRFMEVRPSLIEPISMPETPDVSTSALIDWEPVGRAAIAETASATSTSAYGSTADYLKMVRMMIEKHKVYPQAAPKRRLQGRALVRFVILSDGSMTDLTLVKTSRHGILDEAALAAVRNAGPFPRPPMHLFSGSVPLEICVVFELM